MNPEKKQLHLNKIDDINLAIGQSAANMAGNAKRLPGPVQEFLEKMQLTGNWDTKPSGISSDGHVDPYANTKEGNIPIYDSLGAMGVGRQPMRKAKGSYAGPEKRPHEVEVIVRADARAQKGKGAFNPPQR